MKAANPYAALALFPVVFLFTSRRTVPRYAIDPAQARPNAWPTSADPVLDEYLFDPTVRTADDDLFERWIRDSRSGAPMLNYADLSPSRVMRALTPYEKWALSPYFYAADLSGVIHNGIEPPLKDGQAVPDNAAGVTTPDGKVYFPFAPRSFTNRFWLSVLAHELWHAGQIRIGMTEAESQGAAKRWGYAYSPVEVQARFQQRRVFHGVTEAARKLYAAA